MEKNSTDDLANFVQVLHSRLLKLETQISLLLENRGPLKASDAPAPSNAKPTTDNPISTHALAPKSATASSTAPANFRVEVRSSPEATSPTTSTGSFLGAIGTICFVLAASFIVKLAIDSGWLTPLRQWGLVSTLGVTLIGLGLVLRKNDNDYAGYAAAGGAIVLYFAAYSGSLLFKVIDVETSVAFASGISILCLALFKLFQNELFACTAVIGTYLTPVILGYQSESIGPVSLYFLLWTLVFSTISAHLRSRTTALVAAYFSFGVYAAIHFKTRNPGLYPFIVGVQFLQFAILLGGAIRYTLLTGKALSSKEAWNYFPVLLFFYGVEYHFLSLWLDELAPWISLGFAGLMQIGYFYAKDKVDSNKPLQSRDVVSAFSAVILFHAGYLQILPESIKPYLLLAILGMLLLLGGGSKKNILGIPMIILLVLIAGIEYQRTCLELLRGRNSEFVFFGLFNTLAFFFVYLTTVSKNAPSFSSPFLAITHLMAVLSLYRIAIPSGSLAVSIAWGGYSLAVLILAFSRKDWTFARSSLLILILAAGKALLVDASGAPSTVRILCLLLTGALLYFAGFLFRKIGLLEAQAKS